MRMHSYKVIYSSTALCSERVGFGLCVYRNICSHAFCVRRVVLRLVRTYNLAPN